MIRRLVRIGVLDDTRMRLDYVLALKTEDFLERRLQTQVFKLGCVFISFPLVRDIAMADCESRSGATGPSRAQSLPCLSDGENRHRSNSGEGALLIKQSCQVGPPRPCPHPPTPHPRRQANRQRSLVCRSFGLAKAH